MITIGYGFGLLSLSDLVADAILLNMTEKRKLFKQLKELDAQNYLNSTNCDVNCITPNGLEVKYIVRI